MQRSRSQVKSFEREFLKLAGWMFACNLRAMGGEVLKQHEGDGFEGALQGMQDYCFEMRMVCRQHQATK